MMTLASCRGIIRSIKNSSRIIDGFLIHLNKRGAKITHDPELNFELSLNNILQHQRKI